MLSDASSTEDPGRIAAPDAEILSRAVKEILDSPSFQRSHRLSQLLGYLAERTVEQDFVALKECAIGHRVFSRPATYNAAEDNIVRSNIHQLRLKLGEILRRHGSDRRLPS